MVLNIMGVPQCKQNILKLIWVFGGYLAIIDAVAMPFMYTCWWGSCESQAALFSPLPPVSFIAHYTYRRVCIKSHYNIICSLKTGEKDIGFINDHSKSI